MNVPLSNPTEPFSERILVVDDDATLLMMTKETLRQSGYSVTAFSDPIEAQEAIRRETFAVIISDQKMPGLSGLEFLNQAKVLQPHASRILLTGVLDMTFVIDSINKGEIYRYMVKPWIREELLTTVQNALQRYRLICHNESLQATTRAMNIQLTLLNRELEEKAARVAQQNLQLEQLNRSLQDNLERSVELCVKTMQVFYPTLGNQARRVSALCSVMAETLRLPTDQRQVLEMSGWLHDIGLVGVSRSLIRRWQERPEGVSVAEQELIHQHPLIGQELVGFVSHLKQVGQIIRLHHERFDGAGFPDRLKGEEIPWLGRLLAVAVGYSESKYNGREAQLSIEVNQGTAFDPEAVRVLVKSLPQAMLPRREKEILFSELQPGMVLARGIYNSNGMLLLPEGQHLSDTSINKLHAHNRVSPISQSLQVYV